MKIDDILAITFSGIRPGETQSVKELITGCGLSAENISEEILKNFIVARKGDQLVGVVGIKIAGTDGLLRSLGISESFRNQGIATDLIKAIERFALSRGVATLYLLTLTAEGFFIKQGYGHTDRKSAPAGMQTTKEFQDLCPDTAVCLRKKISPMKTD